MLEDSTNIPTTSSSYKTLMTDWSYKVIRSAQQRMFTGKEYLRIVDGLPVYIDGGDSWVNDNWWVEAASASYKRFLQSDAPYCTNTLEVLLRYFPDKYREEARSQISRWWSVEENHDPEYWWELGLQVWQDHPMFEVLYECPENDFEWSILAKLDYKDSRIRLSKELTEYEKEGDYYWVNKAIRCLTRRGGLPLVRAIISEKQLDSIKRRLVEYAYIDTSKLSFSHSECDNILSIQESTLKISVYLDWQEAIEALSKNAGYLQRLDWFDIAWWSLTQYKQDIVNDFVINHQPYTIHPTKKGLPNYQKLMLAIAWNRTMAER